MGSVLFDGCSILFWNLGICRFLADIADARSGLKRKTVNWAYIVCIRRTREYAYYDVLRGRPWISLLVDGHTRTTYELVRPMDTTHTTRLEYA